MDFGLNHLWSTPVMLDRIEQTEILNDFVQELFLKINLDNPPRDSKLYDILRDGDNASKNFASKVVEPAFEKYLNQVSKESLNDYEGFEFRSWTNPSRGDQYIEPHNHSRALISGVFYLWCDDEDNGGEFHIMDPRPNVGRGYGKHLANIFRKEYFLPKTGDLIIFPSYLFHYTSLFTGNRRLALSVDLMHSSHDRKAGIKI